MYQDYSQFLQWVQLTIQAQENRISSMEQNIQKLLEEVKQLKAKPGINVEKIEYKFDQLKVETFRWDIKCWLKSVRFGRN